MTERSYARRRFLAALPVTFLAAVCPFDLEAEPVKGRSFPSTAVRYADPSTETVVVRLTDPNFSSRIPVSPNHVLTSKGLLYASDLGGSWQAFWMDLKSRSPKQLTEAAALDADSLALQPNGRGFWHFDGPALLETQLNTFKTREIYRIPEGNRKTSWVTFNESGTHAAFIEQGARNFLRLLDLAKGSATTLFESELGITDPLLRPRHNSVLYRVANQGESVWQTGNFDGSETHPLALSQGETQYAQWSSDGAGLLYLNRPADPHKLTALREWTPETGADSLIANTTQYVSFHANPNASIFIGSSGSKASPYVLLLTRSGKRELTLAEHRASDPAMVAPQFSPNSQFVIFSSDRHGKPAIYWIAVDKLVSETDGS